MEVLSPTEKSDQWDIENLVHPARIKGRAIIWARPSTKYLFCRMSRFSDKNFSPVQFFPTKISPVPKNNKELSPVLSTSKIGRPSFYTGGVILLININ